ncbi:DUF3375 family protein [Sphaerisporangium sp. NPDC051017]|uniref:DUF3375 family protein n=1 Tax=Sphaerisporangium sp. NPDC051017 TaxID=3154636 RepID=UPI003448A915
MQVDVIYTEFGQNSTADVAMSLLRSHDALLYLTLMSARLGDGQVVDGLTLTAMLEEDLDLLRHVRHQESDQLPAAAALLTKWTKKGWVHRSVDPDTRMERYQLTSGASQAVQQMRNLQRQGSVATESALAMVMAGLRQIATQANPDPKVHRKAIDEQMAALVAQREALDRGELPEVSATELVDKVTALAQLIERIPTDLARYGEQMHANTATLLRQSLTDNPAEFAESLIRMFDGHDVIASSPEGQAFRAFAELVGIPAQRTHMEADIHEIITRVKGLPPHLADTLSGFIETMWQRVQEVEDMRRVAFRRMSNFVRGGDALHYRSMRTRITEAQAAAAEAFKRTHPGRDIGFVVPMSGLATASVGRLRLDEGVATLPEPVDSGDEFEIDPAALAGREAINWPMLRAAVHAAIDAHGGFATLPEVLEQLTEPRTGDVIGIWSLATDHGAVDDSTYVTVQVTTNCGQRDLHVPYLVFADQLPDPLLPTPPRTALTGRRTLTFVKGSGDD